MEYTWTNNVQSAVGGLWSKQVDGLPAFTGTTFNMNFRRALDGRVVYVAADSATEYEKGIYAKYTNDDGATYGYGRVGADDVFHFNGQGAPTSVPERAGLVRTNNEGEIYVSAGTTIYTTNQPSGTPHNFVHAKYARFGSFDNLSNLGDGAFSKDNDGTLAQNQFTQLQGHHSKRGRL